MTTTRGADGLDLRAGEHALFADDPDAFADACLALLRRGAAPELRRRRAFGSASAPNKAVRQLEEPFVGHDVSLDGVSDLVVKLAMAPGLEVRRSLGISEQ